MIWTTSLLPLGSRVKLSLRLRQRMVSQIRVMVVFVTDKSDIQVDVGPSSMEEGVYDPVQRILDQVRTVKVASR